MGEDGTHLLLPIRPARLIPSIINRKRERARARAPWCCLEDAESLQKMGCGQSTKIQDGGRRKERTVEERVSMNPDLATALEC